MRKLNRKAKYLWLPVGVQSRGLRLLALALALWFPSSSVASTMIQAAYAVGANGVNYANVKNAVFRIGRAVIPNTYLLTVGEIEAANDVDLYHFTAKAGKHYVIETYLGSLQDTVLTLYGKDATTQLGVNDDGGKGRASRLAWTAPGDGVYHFSVRAYASSQTGLYAVSVNETFSFFGGGGCNLGLGVSCPLPGNISTPGGAGWHAFLAAPGTTHYIVTSLGSLADSTITLYAGDTTTPLAFNDDIQESLPSAYPSEKKYPSLDRYVITPRASALEFTIPYAGPAASFTPRLYFVKVQGYTTTQSGDYAIWVQNPERLPNDLIGCLFGPVACAASIAFSLITFWTASSAY